MVGVPGRSKACHTCRQRRIKCDGGRPECNNCAKANRQCGGYQRKHAFILHKDMQGLDLGPKAQILDDEGDSGKVVVSRWRVNPDANSSSKSSKRSTKEEAGDEPDSKSLAGSDHSSPSAISVFSSSSGAVATPLVSPFISSRYALRQQLFSVFLQTHMPTELLESYRPGIMARNFLGQLMLVPDIAPALDSAILAVCTARIGRLSGEGDTCIGSLSLYAESMHHLRRAIADPRTARSDQTLAACTALTMYEVTECPGLNVKGYFTHVEGAMKLLRLRGPENCTTGLSHSLFHALRLHGVFQSFAEDRGSFLRQPEWREIPFSVNKKGYFDEILDQLFELGAFISVKEPPKGDLYLHRHLVQALTAAAECWRVDDELASWLARFDAAVDDAGEGPISWHQPAVLGCSADTVDPRLGPVFPVTIYFRKLLFAQTMGMYWVAVAVLYTHFQGELERLGKIAARAAQLAASGHSLPCTCGDGAAGGIRVGGAEVGTCLAHFDLGAVPPVPTRLGPRPAEDAVRSICQSSEFYVQDHMGVLGSTIAMPMLLMARAYTDHINGEWARERVFITEMIARIEQRGAKLAKFL